MGNETELHTLIPLADFKAVLSLDDREDCLDFASMQNPGHEFLHGKNSANSFQPPSLAAFCLVTATFTIEQYCKRRLLRRKHTDYLTFSGDHIFTLREYPVRKVLSVHAATTGTVLAGRPLFGADSLVAPEHYYCLPDEGIHEDIPFSLVLRPPKGLSREEQAIRVRYLAGYTPGKAPPDLASACLELAGWNMARYRERRIGLTGAVWGKGQDGEHLEPSMPENVRGLLEPYKRRVI